MSIASDAKPHNMSEIMAAIQKVLADHDVGQARVVLELFDEADQQQQQQQQEEMSNGGAVTATENCQRLSPLPPVAGPPPLGRQTLPNGRTSTAAVLLPMGPDAPSGDGPMRSPERQAPPPRPQSSSELCTHMMGGGGSGGGGSAARRSLAPPPAVPKGHRLGSMTDTDHTTTTPATVVDASVAPPAALDATVTELEHTARPHNNERSAGSAAETAQPLPPTAATVQNEATTTAATEKNTQPPLPGQNRETIDPSSLLPQDLFQELHRQESRAERLRVLKGFVGHSALLDDKKQREAAKRQQQKPASGPNAFLSQYQRNVSGGSGGGASIATANAHRGTALSSSSSTSPRGSSTVRLSVPHSHIGGANSGDSSTVTSASTMSAAASGPPGPRLPALSGGGGVAGTPCARKGNHVPGKSPIFGILKRDSSTGGDLGRESSSIDSGNGGSCGGGGRRQNSVSVKEEPPAPRSPVYEPVLGEAAARAQPDSILRRTSSTHASSGGTNGNGGGLPTLAVPGSDAAGGVYKDTFTAVSRENAARAAMLRAGVASSDSPTKASPATSPPAAVKSCLLERPSTTVRPPIHPTSSSSTIIGDSTHSSAGATLSLKDMLKDQQRMERESQAALREHAEVMDRARRFLAGVAEKDKVKAHLDTWRAERAVDGAVPRSSVVTPARAQPPQPSSPTPPPPPARPSSAGEGGGATVSPRRAAALLPTPSAAATPSTPPDSLWASMDGMRGGDTAATPPTAAAPLSVGTSPTRSPRQSMHGSTAAAGGSSGIQVVKFTMPTEPAAREEVVAQLSRSPAGQQHISTKDKYAVLLSGQTQTISQNEEHRRKYQELVERAVELNGGLSSGGHVIP